MKSQNRYILTFESYKLDRIRLKNRLERKKWGKINQRRMEREKKYLDKLIVNPDETIPTS